MIPIENYSLEQSFIFKVIVNVGYLGIIKISFIFKPTLRSQFARLRTGYHFEIEYLQQNL